MASLALSAPCTEAAPPNPAAYEITLETIHSGYDGIQCWVHPRAGIVPDPAGGLPSVVLTMQRLWVQGSDVFDPLNDMRTDDGGLTWRGPTEQARTLGSRAEPGGITVQVSDFWPKWHAASGRLLGIGHTVRYRGRAVLPVRTRETAWSVYDPASHTWRPWSVLAMPAELRFANAWAGSVQRVDEPDGDILPIQNLPRQVPGRKANPTCEVPRMEGLDS